MEEKIIKLNEIKVAIFDFDDTLAIHQDKEFFKHRNESESNFLSYFINAYTKSTSFYDTIEPCSVLEPLYKLVKFFEKSGVKMYCVTGMQFSFNIKAKEAFVHNHYSDKIEVISTNSQKSKVEAIKIIGKLNECKLNEILFVDDLEENIARFKNIGIKALLPSEVGILSKDL